MNVADQLIANLEQAGVKRIYAITGDSLNGVNDAVHRNGKMQWIHVRHEETGAFAAAAEAQISGSLACCAGSSGPGHVHLVNGIYEATRSYSPVIGIASTCPTMEYGTGYFQETEPLRLFDDCTVYNQMATTPKQLPRMLQQAMQAAINKKGAAIIGLPGDITSLPAQDGASAQNSFETAQKAIPTDEEVQALAQLLNSHNSVALFCGYGCAAAHDEVAKLASLLNATVTVTARGKQKLAYDMPGYVGLNGLCGNQAGFSSLWEAEVMLLLGCDYPYDGSLPKNNVIAQVDCDATHLGRRAKVQLGICGDMKLTLDKLLPLIKQKTDDTFLRKMMAVKENDYKENQAKAADHGTTNQITPQYVMQVIDKLTDDNAIFTVDTGINIVWASQFLNATGKRDLLASYMHASMANAMPMAIGASLAAPQRQVVALCGDGGISMLLGDLATIVQYKLPIKLIVFNNRSLGFVKLEMEMEGIPAWQTQMYNPDFAGIAMDMGMKGYNVTEPDQVEATIKEALGVDGPALVNIFTNANEVPALPNFRKP